MKPIDYIKEHSDLSDVCYADIFGVKRYAPFFTTEEVAQFHNPDDVLSFGDFYVAINLLVCNHYEKLYRLSSSEQLTLLVKAVQEWI